MSQFVGIEQLSLSKRRPPGPIPRVPPRLLEVIRAHGPIDPVVVRPAGDHQFEILSNPETWLAVQQLGQREVPIEIRDNVSDREAEEIVAHAYSDARIDPITEAESLAEQMETLGGRDKWGATRQLAALIGLSRSYISHALRLLDLPVDIQELVRAGTLQVGHAKLLVTVESRHKQLQLAQKICRENLSVRAAEKLTRALRTGVSVSDPDPSTQPDPDIVRLEQRVTELIGCRVNVDVSGGKLIIDYASDLEVLDGVLKRLGFDES